MFSINYQLCKEFPALTPYDLDKRRYHDVIKLFAEVRGLQIHMDKMNDPDRVVRRPAGDNWF